MDKSGTVLITGASSGIGFELAKIFAHNKYNLVLVAKNRGKLTEAAKKLQNGSISVWCFAKDLSNPHTPTEIYKELLSRRIVIDVLINNAGFGTYGPFIETSLEEELDELQVNISALTQLTKLFAKAMAKRRQGKILNVASTAAFLPGPLMAVYYASKAYVLSFSQALSNELEGTGVSVSVLCPGTTNTGFAKRAHLERSKLFMGKNMDAQVVARIAYQGLMKNKVIIIPGLKNRLLVGLTRLTPHNLILKTVRRLQEET